VASNVGPDIKEDNCEFLGDRLVGTCKGTPSTEKSCFLLVLVLLVVPAAVNDES